MKLAIVVSRADVHAAIEALEYMAHNEAAQTQEPNLYKKEDYEAWALAQNFRALLSSCNDI